MSMSALRALAFLNTAVIWTQERYVRVGHIEVTVLIQKQREKETREKQSVSCGSEDDLPEALDLAAKTLLERLERDGWPPGEKRRLFTGAPRGEGRR